ncbi:MAG: YraN family protein [Thermogutta sp.]
MLWKLLRDGREWLRQVFSSQARPGSSTSSNNPRVELGRNGEHIATQFLVQRGCTILAQNVRYPEGELDLVVRDGGWLVFVEVRTRQSLKYGEIWESITPAKQRRVVRAAQRFRRERRLFSMPCRFDLITVFWPEDCTQPTITHFPHAFDAD